MKICLTGAAGMLGSAIICEFEQLGNKAFNTPCHLVKSDIDLRSPDIQGIDVRNLKEIENWVREEKPDLFFHLAAETDVDRCELDPDHAYKTNFIGTENIALICQKFDIPMLYISTAAVFYGDKLDPYVEFDHPRPINVYGMSKLFGEIVVQRLLRKYFIVRAGWMIGAWEIDKKFVSKIAKQIMGGKKEINVVNDKLGSPTFARDFAKNLIPLIKTERYGLYHMANLGVASRFEIAVKIVEFMGLQGKVKVNPVSSEAFPLPAPRPRSEMLKNYHLELIGINHMPHWEQSLKEYIHTYLNHLEDSTLSSTPSF